MMYKKIYFLIFFWVSVWMGSVHAGDISGEDRSHFDTLYIAGGHPLGTRFSKAGTVCMFVKDAGCAVMPSQTTLQSLEFLASGRVDFAMVQSDWLHDAVMGKGRFDTHSDIRALAVLGGDMAVLAVRKSSGIGTVSSLAGHTFAMGAEKTYRGLFGRAILDAGNVRVRDLKNVYTYGTDDSVRALCLGKVDATIFVVSHPSAILDDVSAQCDVIFISLSDDHISKIQKKFKGTFPMHLAQNTYWGQTTPIKSVGLYTVLVTTTGVDGNKATYVKRAIDTNMDAIMLHPSVRHMTQHTLTWDVGVPYYGAVQ